MPRRARRLPDLSANGIYLAFLAALALWGWIELAFLSGVITGPNRAPCPRLRQPARPVLARRRHHRLARGAADRHADRPLAWPRCTPPTPSPLAPLPCCSSPASSAKLNLFFGVPRINTQFLPRPLAHLASHFRIGRITAFFPISVSALTVGSALLLERAINVTHPGMSVGYALLTCLCLLALLEHWFMVLPLPDEKLWRWMIPARKPSR